VERKAIQHSNVGEELMLSAASAINLGMRQSFVETKVSNKT